MNVAWISGRSGRAIVETADDIFLLVDGDDGPPAACSRRQVTVQLSTYADLSRVDAGTFPFANVRASLAKAVSADRAHLYALGLLDSELENELRSDLATDLERLLGEQHVADHVEAMLRSAPLPAGVDLRSAIDVASLRGASRVVGMLVGLDSDAPLIDRVCDVWTEFAASLKSDTDAAIARSWFSTSGGFSRLVESLRRGSREPFAQWMLATGREAPRQFGAVPLKAFQHLQSALELPMWSAPVTTHDYVREREEEAHEEPKRRTREDRRPRLGALEVLAKINAQIDEIGRRLKSGDEASASGFLSDLIDFQKDNRSTPEQIAKTLCNIAAQARAAGQLSFAERSLRQALAERPDDGWAHAQLSAVLRAGGRIDEAREAARLGAVYRDGPGGLIAVAEALRAQASLFDALGQYDLIVERFPENAVARNGRAEVLKALGRYDEALGSYDETIARFPADVVARTGRAEVLKALGRYDEALGSYDETIARFPADAVARNGRAEVLKALGRYDEALGSYDEAIARFPENVVARNGRAEVLKALGRYDEALRSYSATIERFAHNAVAQGGRASVLLLVGRFDEALRALPPGEPVAADDWILWHIRGMAHIRLGRLDEAEAILQHGARAAPSPVSRDYFRTALASIQLRRRRYREVVRELKPVVSRMPIAHRTTAVVLLAHASAAIDETREAERWLAETAATRVPVVVELRAALAERYALRVDGRVPARTRPDEEIDPLIDEQEFRLLTLAFAA